MIKNCFFFVLKLTEFPTTKKYSHNFSIATIYHLDCVCLGKKVKNLKIAHFCWMPLLQDFWKIKDGTETLASIWKNQIWFRYSRRW